MLRNYLPTNKNKLTATEAWLGASQQIESNSNQETQELNWRTEEPSFETHSFDGFASLRSDNPVQFKPILPNSSVTVTTRNPEEILVERFAELYLERDTANVSIICGRNHDVFKAHQFVLSAGSIYFRDALMVAPCEHPVIDIKKVSVDVMGRILEYMYLGEVNMKSETELKQFLSSAKYLMLTGNQYDQYSLTN